MSEGGPPASGEVCCKTTCFLLSSAYFSGLIAFLEVHLGETGVRFPAKSRLVFLPLGRRCLEDVRIREQSSREAPEPSSPRLVKLKSEKYIFLEMLTTYSLC